MSYYTAIEFTLSDEPPDLEAVLGRARAYLESRGGENADSVDFVLEQLGHALEEE
jgi:hypothetical protein